MTYLSITVPGRNNVREPLVDPEMRLARASGTIARVPLSEPQLLALIADAASALKRLHARRDATVPHA